MFILNVHTLIAIEFNWKAANFWRPVQHCVTFACDLWDVALEVPQENTVLKSSLFYYKVVGGRVARYKGESNENYKYYNIIVC